MGFFHLHSHFLLKGADCLLGLPGAQGSSTPNYTPTRDADYSPLNDWPAGLKRARTMAGVEPPL